MLLIEYPISELLAGDYEANCEQNEGVRKNATDPKPTPARPHVAAEFQLWRWRLSSGPL